VIQKSNSYLVQKKVNNIALKLNFIKFSKQLTVSGFSRDFLIILGRFESFQNKMIVIKMQIFLKVLNNECGNGKSRGRELTPKLL